MGGCLPGMPVRSTDPLKTVAQLTTDEKDSIYAWVRAGAPEGDRQRLASAANLGDRLAVAPDAGFRRPTYEKRLSACPPRARCAISTSKSIPALRKTSG